MITAQYPLSALQQGMIYHHLLDRGAGVDIEQLVITLPEAVSVPAMRAAFTDMMARHDGLRASYRWEGLEEPISEVHDVVEMPFREEDWSDVDPSRRESRVLALLEEERRIAFDLRQPGVQKAVVIRFGAEDWRLVWTFHHLVFDGSTMMNLIYELFALYEAQRAGVPHNLPVPRPYRDYVAWARTQDFAASEPFWRKRLAGFSAATPLPAANPDPGVQHRQGDRMMWLPAEVTAALESAGKTHSFTMNILVQAVWSIILAKHAGEDDIVFGAIRGCRKSTLPEAPEMIGLFINTLPMRVQVADDQPLLDLLKQIRRSWDELRDLEHTPLRMVQAWSDVPHGKPLFDSLVVYQSYEFEDLLRGQGGVWAERRFRLYEQPPMGVSFSVWGTGKTYVRLGFDRSRIDEATGNRLFDEVITLFTEIAKNPTATVGELTLLSPEARTQVVETFNDTASPVTPDTLHGLIAKQVAAHPDAVALVFNDRQMTYAQLDTETSRIAAGLRRAGVKRNTIVGLCVERGFDFPLGVLSILKAGGAWLPLDPSYPAERLAYMLEDSGAPVLLTQRELAARVPAAPTTLVLEDLRASDAVAAADDVTPDDLAYVIYTSGSTGKPKGAMLLHRGAVNLAAAEGKMFDARTTDRILQFSALSFDASVLEIVWSLCHGARLVLAPKDVIMNPDSLAALIEREGVTGSLMPPVMLRALDPAAAPSLVAVVSGGDACGGDIVDRWAPGRRFYNAYGPTEITVTCAISRVPPGSGRNPPIGGPLLNCRTYVLDAHGAPVPIGVPGELWVGGAGVGAGYLHRPELTAERFVADPFATEPDARMYRTGDRVRWRTDGQIEYLGRFDDQVKLRGFRIELGEIEARLASQVGVQDAAVALQEGEAGEKRLVAYIVPRDAHVPPAVATLRAALGAVLPSYMVPAAFVTMDALPLGPSGKVDRKRLPRPGAEHLAADEREYVAPRTETERRMTALWQQVLRLPRIGVRDNFFELGGDSILSMQIVARGRPTGLALTPKLLFEHGTIEKLSAVLDATTVVKSTTAEGPARGDAPLTPIQHWFFEQQLDEPAWWNQSFLFAVNEALDLGVLRDALRAVMAHHDALRFRYAQGAASWRQWYADDVGELAVTRVDLSRTSDDDIATEIERAGTEAQATLDLAHGPIVRLVYFDLGAARGARLLIAVHHLVIDGVSWRVLLEDVEHAYEQRLRNESVVLPSRTTSFKRWAEELARFATTSAVQQQRAYWSAVCAPGLATFPVERPRGARREGEVRVSSQWLTEEETRALLQRVPAAYNTRIDDVLLSALAMALSQWSGDAPVLVDMEGHGREDVIDGVDLSRTVGWFTSIFPVRLDPSLAKRGPATVLRTVKEQLRAIPQRGLGFGVLRYLGADAALAVDGQIAFNYLGQFDSVVADSRRFSFASEPYGAWRSPRATRRHPMDVLGLIAGGRMELRWHYCADVVDGATVDRLSTAYMQSLRALISHCTTAGVGAYTPSDFPLATLDQGALDRIAQKRGDIEDIYPLVEVQRLFHGFADPATDPGFEQFRYRLTGEVDSTALRAAWSSVVARHPILRTSFVAEGLDQPLQVVHRDVEVSFEELDWRSTGTAEQEQKLAALLRDDRARGFVFERAPLLRFTLVRLAHDRYELVWSHHHLLLDRWSLPLVMRDLAASYAAHRAGRAPSLPAAVPYRSYVQWLAGQQQSAQEAYWRRAFDGYQPSTPIAQQLGASPASDATALDVRFSLSEEETATLQARARELRVPLNAIVQAAWSLWLARQLRSTDVVYGLALAGRPPEIVGVDELVGVTIGNLPLRVRVNTEAPVRSLVASIQEAQTELQQFAHSSLQRVQEWSGVPWRRRLFESILVFQHAGADESLSSWLGAEARVEMVDVGTTTAYPLTLTITGDRALSVQVTADPRIFSDREASFAADGLRSALTAIARDSNATSRAVMEELPVIAEAVIAAAGAAALAERVPPRNPTEQVLARIWSDLLGVSDLGVMDNFLARGGHSLLATQLVSRVRDTFQTQVSVRTLFQSPTVADFAVALRTAEKKPGQVDKIAQLVLRVEGMSIEQLRDAAASRKRAVPLRSDDGR